MASNCPTSAFISLQIKSIEKGILKNEEQSRITPYFSLKLTAFNWFDFLPAVSHQGAYLQQQQECKPTLLSEVPELEFKKEKKFGNPSFKNSCYISIPTGKHIDRISLWVMQEQKIKKKLLHLQASNGTPVVQSTVGNVSETQTSTADANMVCCCLRKSFFLYHLDQFYEDQLLPEWMSLHWYLRTSPAKLQTNVFHIRRLL